MINGILNVYKEKGYTSHDVVAKLRGVLGQRKIGHTGTLDPDAEGVLPVCLGRATKVCDLLTDRDKTYVADLLLGVSTDTQDITGTVIQEKSTAGLTENRVFKCIENYIGEYDQIPPMYSALKIGGKKLCDLAREGKTVERKSRRVLIKDITVLECRLPGVRMQVECSKGTYIRTLCHDIGQDLGTGGCMEHLLRTRAGAFRIEDSLRLDEIRRFTEEGRLSEILIPVDHVFSEYEALVVSSRYSALLYNGNPFRADALQEKCSPSDGARYRIYDEERRFAAIYTYRAEENKFRPEKMFLDPDEWNQSH